MNKKKVNILLIPFAIVVWIIVLYRVFSISSPPEVLPYSKTSIMVADTNLISSDTLQLLLNYRDPFVPGNIFFNNVNVNPDVKEKFQKPLEIKCPGITYLGLIAPDSQGDEIALTIIDKHSFLLTKGDTLNGLTVKDLYQDSIVVEFQNKLFRIMKTKQVKS